MDSTRNPLRDQLRMDDMNLVVNSCVILCTSGQQSGRTDVDETSPNENQAEGAYQVDNDKHGGWE